MSETNKIQAIHLPTYLEVIAKLPDVTKKEVEWARDILQSALGDCYEHPVTFHRGISNGDGRIHIEQTVATEGGSEIRSQLNFSGWLVKVRNDTTGFSKTLPESISPYFIGGIFGVDELPSLLLEKDVLLITGLREFYQCASTQGIDTCQYSTGAGKLANVRGMIRDRSYASSEKLWRAAEAMREAARGWGDGDPDDIQEIMDRHTGYRYYAGTADEVANARRRYEEAAEMLSEIGRSSGGWPQFEKRFCKEPEVTSTRERDCGGIKRWPGPSQSGTVTSYSQRCQFDISKSWTTDECIGKSSDDSFLLNK